MTLAAHWDVQQTFWNVSSSPLTGQCRGESPSSFTCPFLPSWDAVPWGCDYWSYSSHFVTMRTVNRTEGSEPRARTQLSS